MFLTKFYDFIRYAETADYLEMLPLSRKFVVKEEYIFEGSYPTETSTVTFKNPAQPLIDYYRKDTRPVQPAMSDTILSEGVVIMEKVMNPWGMPHPDYVRAKLAQADKIIEYIPYWFANKYNILKWNIQQRFPTLCVPPMPSKGVIVAGAIILAFTAVTVYNVKTWVYRYGTRETQRQILLGDEGAAENYLNGDAGLINNIKFCFSTKAQQYALAVRRTYLPSIRRGEELFDYQAQIDSMFADTENGPEFWAGILSSMGDFRTLSRGEMRIQLNRHLKGFITSRLDARNPLTPEQIHALNAVILLICGQHVTVQVSR